MKTDAKELSEETNLPAIHFYDWLLSALGVGWFVGTLLVFDLLPRLIGIFIHLISMNMSVLFLPWSNMLALESILSIWK